MTSNVLPFPWLPQKAADEIEIGINKAVIRALFDIFDARYVKHLDDIRRVQQSAPLAPEQAGPEAA